MGGFTLSMLLWLAQAEAPPPAGAPAPPPANTPAQPIVDGKPLVDEDIVVTADEPRFVAPTRRDKIGSVSIRPPSGRLDDRCGLQSPSTGVATVVVVVDVVLVVAAGAAVVVGACVVATGAFVVAGAVLAGATVVVVVVVVVDVVVVVRVGSIQSQIIWRSLAVCCSGSFLPSQM